MLPPLYITPIQKVIENILHYVVSVDNTMRVILGYLSSSQSRGKEKTMVSITHLHNHVKTTPTIK